MLHSDWLSNEIWAGYTKRKDLKWLREEILTSPWYVTPKLANRSLIEYAIVSRDVSAVELLNSLGESVNLPANDGFTLLHTAVDCCSNAEDQESHRKAVEVLEKLLLLGADPHRHGMDGTPLHRAAVMGDIDAARVLVQYGADLNLRTLVDGKLTPVQCAKMMNNSKMVEYLIHRAPKDACDAGNRAQHR